MNERTMGIIFGVALTAVGVGDYFGRQSSGSTATILSVVEIVGLVVGVVAGFAGAWLWEREKKA